MTGYVTTHILIYINNQTGHHLPVMKFLVPVMKFLIPVMKFLEPVIKFLEPVIEINRIYI
jgi:hypothetical protein